MASGSPPKPWEINRGSSMGNLRSSADVNDTTTPPPVPARPSQQRSNLYQPSYGTMGGMGYGGLGSYGSSYGLGGYGNMYGSGLYGGSGMYGSSYRSYGNPGMGGFSQQAEDSTRQAFQSVESIVRAFTSVSAMLESTLGAVYSSFRAVLDVAEHFSRVKATFTDILSSIAIFRFLRYLYRRALALLRLRPYDEAWDGAGAGGADVLKIPNDPKSQRKSWPIMLFVAVVVGGPYLIWRLLRGITSQKSETPTWVTGEGDHVIARAEFDFQSEGEEELSFQAGETIILAPKQLQPRVNGWVIGTKDRKTTGYLPTNYVKILGLKRGPGKTATTPQNHPQAPVTRSGSSSSKTMTKIAEEEWENIHSNGGAVSSGDA